MPNTKKLTWKDIIDDVVTVSSNIENVDAIITVGRGGNIPGTMLGYKMGVKHIVNFSVQSYNDDKTATNIRIQQKPDFTSLKNKKVLVVDDLSDKGTTLKYISDVLEQHNIYATYCTLYIKNKTKFIPTFYVKEFNSDVWIEFPWDDLSSLS
jgi:hypoxanthine phosphoribosyltransferase